LYKAKVDEVDSEAHNTSGATPTFDGLYAAPWSAQFGQVMARQWRHYLRNYPFNYTRLILMCVLGVLFGLVFFDIDKTTFPGLNSYVSGTFMTAAFISVISCALATPVLVKQRALFYRELSSNTYHPTVYAVVTSLTELVWVPISVLLFTLIFYWMIGHQSDSFLQYYVAFSLCALYFNAFGSFLSAVMPDMNSAQVLQGLFFSLSFLFGGIFIRGTDVPPGWKWFYAINPVQHAVRAMIMPQLEGDTTPVQDAPICAVLPSGQTVCPPTNTFMQVYYGWKFDDTWDHVGYLALLLLVIRVLYTAGIVWVRHIKR
jgi:ABC-type polysaccharide/polyol phosphate export permease